ncbi:MAG: 2-hydroxyacyl-CoA dehydratase family protein [Candidatus Neomarinimicrobiota bacterium]
MARLQSQEQLRSLLSDYYTDLRSPLAWCTSAGPAEILRALGFRVYFPENHGAVLGASRTAQRYIPKAHQIGYHSEICSYLTSDIGAWLMRETPLTKAYGLPSIPKPDLIVYNTNQCREVGEWFNFFGREFNCPIFGIYAPRHLEDVTIEHIEHVRYQFQNLIDQGEKIIGKRLDQEQLVEIMVQSQKGTQLWQEVLATAKNSPAPLTFFDGCILMAPIVVMRGTRECVDFYEQTLKELLKRVEQQEATIQSDNVRLFWDGMPIWGRLRSLSELFENNQAAVVSSTYCNSWVFDDFDPRKPLESMAAAYTRIFINRGENAKLSILKTLLADFNIDGVIFHDSKTCFNNTNSRFGLPKRVREETGIDTLQIDGDLNDLRFFSDGQTKTRIETFIEQLILKKISVSEASNGEVISAAK